MSPSVTKHNWPACIKATLDAVLTAAGSYPPGSAETDVLVREAAQLRHMCEIVRDVPPENREGISSYLINVSLREGLSFPNELIEQVGAVYKVYRLWRRELTWQS